MVLQIVFSQCKKPRDAWNAQGRRAQQRKWKTGQQTSAIPEKNGEAREDKLSS
jgi:hypothetical protein